jgi:hypothetical protein
MSAFVKLLSADFYFNQEVKMQTTRILSLGLLAAMMFGCEQASAPATPPQSRQQAVPTINALTKIAALSAGYQMSREAVLPDELEEDEGNPFDPEKMGDLSSIGLCPNFVLLVQEMIQGISANPQSLEPIFTPRLKKVVMCLENKAQAFSSQPSDAVIFGIISDCFCDGSGSLFLGIDNFAFNAYAPPGVPGGKGYAAPVAATPYAAPTSTGYSAPAISGYAAPSL